MLRKTDVNGVVLILFFSLGLGLGVNWFSPSGIALVGQWNTSEGVVTAKAKNDTVHSGIEINDPMKVYEIVTGNAMVVLDVRPGFSYEEGHLPGALSFPLDEFDQRIDRLLALVTKESPVLVYCSGFHCTDSHTFADQLMAMGFSKVLVYGGGFEQWQEMGFEVE